MTFEEEKAIAELRDSSCYAAWESACERAAHEREQAEMWKRKAEERSVHIARLSGVLQCMGATVDAIRAAVGWEP